MERGIKRRRDLGIGEVKERKKVCGGFVKGSLTPALKKKLTARIMWRRAAALPRSAEKKEKAEVAESCPT